MYLYCISTNLYESPASLTYLHHVSTLSPLPIHCTPLKPNKLYRLYEPYKLNKLHDAPFSPCSNEEFMLIWNSCGALTN